MSELAEIKIDKCNSNKAIRTLQMVMAQLVERIRIHSSATFMHYIEKMKTEIGRPGMDHFYTSNYHFKDVKLPNIYHHRNYS